ncbi:MAG: tyrosine-type recombinase/integrase [Terriglobia bacterium]
MRVIRRVPAILGDRLFRAFVRSLRLVDLAEATRRGYAGDLGRFRRWIEETRGARAALGRVNTVDLVNYRQHLIRSEKLRASSVNRKVQALKKFFAWAQQQKIIRSNPATALRFLRRPAASQPKGLQPAEVQRSCGPPARPATGWRAGTTPSFRCCSKPACGWARPPG